MAACNLGVGEKLHKYKVSYEDVDCRHLQIISLAGSYADCHQMAGLLSLVPTGNPISLKMD